MDRVRDYYANQGEREWSRLDTPSGSLEFTVNTHFIARHLPATSRVLDIGGGPGRYTLWLAERGHRVVLADLSAELLALAENRIASSPVAGKVEDVALADARDLSSWHDGEFDAALSLGPFYHLLEPAERDRAASELHRVIRPGGLLFAALMPRYAFLRRAVTMPAERHQIGTVAFVEDLMRQGVFRNDVPGRFTDGYGVLPTEVVPFFERHGFESIDLIASEGLGAGIEDVLFALAREEPAAHENLMQIIISTAGDASLHGLTSHLLYIGLRSETGA